MAFNLVYSVNPTPKIVSKVEYDEKLNLGNHFLKTIDVSKYSRVQYFIQNLSETDLKIHVRYSNENKSHHLFDGEKWVQNDEIIIPGGTQFVYCLNTVFPFLDELVTDKISFRLQHTKSVEQTGNVKITIKGCEL